MRRFILLSSLFLSTAACTDFSDDQRISQIGIALAAAPCESAQNPNCVFINGPVALQGTPLNMFGRKTKFYATAENLSFIDAQSKKWHAPSKTLTDGASIPAIFIPVIGAPNSKEFANAAAVHDAYCGIGNENHERFHSESWQNVHRMFYGALRIGGTPAIKAKIMYSAVYLGGPRWSKITSATPKSASFLSNPTVDQFRKLSARPARTLGHVSNARMIEQLEQAIAFIENNNPSLMDLEFFLLQLESKTLETREHSAEQDHYEVEQDPYYDPGSYDLIP